MLGDCGLPRSMDELGIVRSCSKQPSAAALQHQPLDLGDRFAGVQSLRTRPGAVQDGMTPVEPERIFELVQPFAGYLVTRAREPAPGLEQRGRAQKTISVPPVAWAARRAAEAQNALIVAVDVPSLVDRLEPFPLRLRRLGLQPRPDHLVLRENMGEVWDQILDDPHIRERINRCGHIGSSRIWSQ